MIVPNLMPSQFERLSPVSRPQGFWDFGAVHIGPGGNEFVSDLIDVLGFTSFQVTVQDATSYPDGLVLFSILVYDPNVTAFYESNVRPVFDSNRQNVFRFGWSPRQGDGDVFAFFKIKIHNDDTEASDLSNFFLFLS